MAFHLGLRIYYSFVKVVKAMIASMVRLIGSAIGVIFICLPAVICANESTIEVESYYGVYKTANKLPGRPAPSLVGPITEKWQSPSLNPTMPKNGADGPKKSYKIGVLVPHLQDPYWLGVNYGLIEQARKLNVGMKILSAGGYRKGGIQRKQLTEEMLNEHNVDGVILAPIHYDRLDKFIAGIVKAGVPVVSLVNDIFAPKITAKTFVSHYRLGYELGKYVVEKTQGKDFKVAFFPGPKGSGWAEDVFAGFTDAIRENPKAYPLGKVTIVAQQYGFITKEVQHKLVDFVLGKKEGINYLIGNSVAVQEAVKLLDKHQVAHPGMKIISTYLTPDLYDLLDKEQIWAAAADFMVEQARIAVDLMVRVFNGDQPGSEPQKMPFLVRPKIQIVDQENFKKLSYESLFGYKGYQPTWQYVAG